ncbi:NADPH oxidase regulator NoxR [Coprinopsis cinerea okayama7|uniref:NADPH oxidase regulator NoxR n=1 Tax=Coprinopsis cinerea (strain Okayama-7 / 130 / ATCC MYA-4618 / FGSC 9003) TaxID=240176 RepID=D6RLD4_COPC7|nr:NADPH oxidase regulator NoxR [Coprinopsis cinerea okayama7\|eukprot:XP_002911655.1 NADPH oxidase regulator NoxR [Coprinopsis cinerea okayama7\
MSLKAELETWAAALKAYDDQDFDKALQLFSEIADNSKIHTNIGLIYATLGEHEEAVKHFIEATGMDQYLAVAYFQCGVSNFLLQRYELALKDFEEALLHLRQNQTINYEQLGLQFKLYSAEVLFNMGLSLIFMGQIEMGLQNFEAARREKATEDHNVIDEAIRDQGRGYTVFSIPVGVLYRPSEKKLKNAVQKDYMGKAKLVASSDPDDKITTFVGSARLKMGISPAGIYIDRPDIDTPAGAAVSRSATVPASSYPASRPAESIRSAGLERSKTTINVPSNARALTSPQSLSPSSRLPPVSSAGALGRSNTQITPGRPSPSAGMGGPSRGMSVRRAASPSSGGAVNPLRVPPKNLPDVPAPERITEFYDDYLDSYEDQPPVPQLSAPPTADRVATWARQTPAYPAGVARSTSRSAPNSQYAPSSYGGGSMRRKPTRRATSRQQNRIGSTYEEEEEGYGSGDYDDGPFEMNLIRVKLHYQDETRGMTLAPDLTFNEFIVKITAKFNKSFSGLGLKFKDEDGGKVTLRDESDYELAIETARENAKGRAEGKLEIWCTDI